MGIAARVECLEDLVVAAALVESLPADSPASLLRENPGSTRARSDPQEAHRTAVCELLQKYAPETVIAAAKRLKRPAAEPLSTPYASYAWLVQTYPQLVLGDHEEFVVVGLDARLCPVAHIALPGGATLVAVEVRDIFRWALLQDAVRVLLVAHGHPSGNPEPSADDRRLTSRLVMAGRLIGIEVVDHLVVGAASYMSFAEQGRMAADEA